MRTTTWRCVYVTESTVVPDAGTTYRTPVDSLDSLATLLGRVATRIHPNGATVVLGDGLHERLGFPRHFRKAVSDHPALNEARARGWEVSDVSPWMTFHREDGRTPKVHVGIDPWLVGGKEGNFALKDDQSVPLTQMRMLRFHQWLGVPYYGANAGLPGIDLLRDHHKGAIPRWAPKNWARIEPALVPSEVVTVGWRSALTHDLPYEHQYDARLQFLSAAISGEYALETLEPAYLNRDGSCELRDGSFTTPARPFPGYYLVTVPPWRYADRMPHPMGDHTPGDKVWITAPTLQLVHELANANQPFIDAPEIHDAWVAKGSRVFRYWGEAISKAEERARVYGDDVLVNAVKMVYKAGIGMLATEDTGRIRRPDWEHSIKALARSNMWRKMWRYGWQSGRWPVEINWDAMWYASSNATVEWLDDVIFPNKVGPGGYRYAGMREVTR